MKPEQAVFTLNFLVPVIENESQTTRKVIAAVPEAKRGYKPDANARTAFELAWHIAQTDVWFLDGVANGEFQPGGEKPAEIQTIADVLAWHEKNFPAALAKVKTLTPEKLTQTVNFYGIFNHPAVVYLMFLNNHRIHHRGQLATYLRPMGAKVPNIYGGSFDEPMEMAAQS